MPIASGTFRATTKGVRVPVGESRTIEVDLFSEAPVAPWRVRAVDLAALEGRPARLLLSLDRDQGRNGDRLTLTIHALSAGENGGERFVLYSDDGVHDAFFIGYVAN